MSHHIELIALMLNEANSFIHELLIGLLCENWMLG